jgi:hypothetical protein
VVLWPERDVYVRPPHHSPGLDALSQADLLLELLPFCLCGDEYATSKDQVDLSHLLIIARGIGLAMFAPSGLLGHPCYWWWHLLVIQKSFALFQIMSRGSMDLAPLLHVVRVTERHLLFLI